MALTHPCPKNQCPVQVEQDMFACKKHWFQISAETRRRIWRAYRFGDVREHLDAMAAAQVELDVS